MGLTLCCKNHGVRNFGILNLMISNFMAFLDLSYATRFVGRHVTLGRF